MNRRKGRERGIEGRKDGQKKGWGEHLSKMQHDSDKTVTLKKRERNNNVLLQLSSFYCMIKHILLEMPPRNTAHEDRKHLELERAQGFGKAALLSVITTENKTIPFSVQEAFIGTTRRLALLKSSLKHKRVVGGSAERKKSS